MGGYEPAGLGTNSQLAGVKWGFDWYNYSNLSFHCFSYADGDQKAPVIAV